MHVLIACTAMLAPQMVDTASSADDTVETSRLEIEQAKLAAGKSTQERRDEGIKVKWTAAEGEII
jgi:hypothetical protein